MTPQEQQMLDGLIGRVRNAQVTTKDADADRRIQDTLGKDPNALYVLCQTVLVQGYALEQAQKQIAALKDQASQNQPQQHEPTFLEKIFGRSDDDKPANAPQPSGSQAGYGAPVYSDSQQDRQPQYGQTGYGRPGYPQQAPPPPYPGQPGYGQPYPPAYPQQYGGAPAGMGGGGFLQGALQTAAGVAIGTMAVQGIEGLFHGFGNAAGYGSDRAMGFGDVSGGNNNDGDGGQGDGFFSREQAENGVNDQLSPDIEDRRGDSSGFADTGDSNSANGFLNNDDSATDSGYDIDNSGMEPGGSDFTDSGDSGFDDGGGSFDDNN